MNYLLQFVVFVLGFYLLVKGADLFVDGSSSVAKLFKIPSVIIGLTIVSIGTSLPEAAVSITAAMSGSYDLSIANIIGSNLFNLLVVLGVSAIICPFAIDKMIMKRDFPISVALTVVLAFMLRDNTLSRIEAGVFAVLFVSYIAMLIASAKKNRQTEEEYKTLSPARSIIYILFGGAGIIAGGQFTVNSAVFFAEAFGMSQMLIGLTIIAVGTSLPELVTSIVAAKKGESDIALGNVVGSNIFNILFILGSSGLVHPLFCDGAAFIDTIFIIIAGVVMYCVCITDRKVTRVEGTVCVIAYVLYILYAALRGYGLI